MQSQINEARVVQIASPFKYTLLTSTYQTIKLQLDQTEAIGFYHLLKRLANSTVTFKVLQKYNSILSKTEYKKGKIWIYGQQITTLYSKQTHFDYITNQINKNESIKCYIVKAQCLKLCLFVLNHSKIVSFYFSELKIPRPQGQHPKDVWDKSYSYFQEQLQGQFVQIRVIKCEKYRQQTEIYGQMFRLSNNSDIVKQILIDGYADLSEKAKVDLSPKKLSLYMKFIQQSKENDKGLWKSEYKYNKMAEQSLQIQYQTWQKWIKSKRKLSEIKNSEEEMKIILNQLRKQNTNKLQLQRILCLLEVSLCLLDEQTVIITNLKYVQEVVKNSLQLLLHIQINILHYLQNYQFLKCLNRIITLPIFYLLQIASLKENIKDNSKENFKESSQDSLKKLLSDMQKVIKLLFKTAYIGNQTFHEKIFGRKKQCNYEEFTFDSIYLKGISSYSQYSDLEQIDQSKIKGKHNRKINSCKLKIRINSTLLLRYIFLNYPTIVEKQWQICIRPNILTEQFLTYLRNLKINTEPNSLTAAHHKQIVTLMRTNFGDHSLLLLSIFQHSSKVKINAIHCLLNMITNLHSKKMINTTQTIYMEKLLKQTKSSFIPKSFIIFAGLRNALYLMLFSLHHQKNIDIIVLTFQTLSELCKQCTLIDKMGFQDGMGLLMSNYIIPVLQFSWQIPQLKELKCASIAFLTSLVSSQKKWDQIQIQYMLSAKQSNINFQLLSVIELECKQNDEWQQNKIIIEIIKYFTTLCKKYYLCLYFKFDNKKSVWGYLSNLCLNKPTKFFSKFIEEIYKCNYDQNRGKSDQQSLQLSSEHIKLSQSNLLQQQSQQLGIFLGKYIPIYSQFLQSQNYISLLNTITYVDYDSWGKKDYTLAKKFLLHCFNSLRQQSESIQFVSLKTIRTNTLVRIGLIKMVGYMSFCQQFQTKQYVQSSIRLLLQLSLKYKSINSIIKLTWGLSNWCKVENFVSNLNENELELLIEYMIKHSQSQRQKIASNSTRGLGFIMSKVKIKQQKCRKAIIDNMSHLIIKVRTNSTKTLREIRCTIKNQQIIVLVPFLEQNLLKNNYHLQIQTLQLIKHLGTPIAPDRLLKLYIMVLKNLLSHTTMEYEFSQINTLKQLRRTLLGQVLSMPQILKEHPDTIKDVLLSSILSYLIDCDEQKGKPQNKIMEKGQQRDKQVQKAVFNVQYHRQQEETIETAVILRGIKFEAYRQDIHVIKKIKDTSQHLVTYGFKQWQQIAALEINGLKVSMGQYL